MGKARARSPASGNSERRGGTSVWPALTLVVHEPPAELLESATVAHGPQGAVELVVGHHQVLGVPSHVYDLPGGGRRGPVTDPSTLAGSQTHSPPHAAPTPHFQHHGHCHTVCRLLCSSRGTLVPTTVRTIPCAFYCLSVRQDRLKISGRQKNTGPVPVVGMMGLRTLRS